MSKKELNTVEIKILRGVIHIVGTSPLIQHAFSEKSKRQMYEKQTGAAKLPVGAKDPQVDFENAMYRLADGRPGIAIEAIKKGMKSAAALVSIKEATKLGQALYIEGIRTPRPVAHPGASSSLNLVPLVASEPEIREDLVRVGTTSKTTDIRYRPEFTYWGVRLCYKLNPDIMTEDEIACYLAQAGHGVGVGEWRNQKNGQFGGYRLATEEEAHLLDTDHDAFIAHLMKVEKENAEALYPDLRKAAA